ncbi:MAG: SCP2 sterol-binding domain-containing protein [Proteobacteria bacterium]|nr:SCP2 sterol-binding domain-containing protein [Pseudomonadota bacterium]
MITGLSALHERLAPHFKPAFIQRDYTCFQFRFDDGEPFFLTVTPTTFEFSQGEKPDPTLTLYLDNHETCEALLEGRINSMDAFMEGRYRADGNIVLSQLLLYLFRNDDPTIAYRVQD